MPATRFLAYWREHEQFHGLLAQPRFLPSANQGPRPHLLKRRSQHPAEKAGGGVGCGWGPSRSFCRMLLLPSLLMVPAFFFFILWQNMATLFRAGDVAQIGRLRWFLLVGHGESVFRRLCLLGLFRISDAPLAATVPKYPTSKTPTPGGKTRGPAFRFSPIQLQAAEVARFRAHG